MSRLPATADSPPPAGGVPRFLCIGASTGGTEAIRLLLERFPADCPPTLIVQHMPQSFTGAFARRLDGLCRARVCEALGGERIEPGMVYIAPGHSHLLIRRVGNSLQTELSDGPPVNRHRPSVDVLFDSAAQLLGKQAVGVLLTGMGKDGARGLLRMRQSGARTFAQDEASCVVYGMPREAVLLGAVDEVVRLDEMTSRVMGLFGRAAV